MRSLALIAALCMAVVLAACKKPAPAPQPAAADEPPPTLPAPEFLPSALGVKAYVGAEACAGCHRAEYDAWRASPHGRSMADASPATVLATFEGKTKLADGEVAFSRDGDRYVMDLTSGSHHERRYVDLALASGRQHQIYVVKEPGNVLRLLPVVWSTKTKEWLPLALYQDAALDPSSPAYWGGHDMTRGCLSCHLSQAYRHVDSTGATNRWVDLSVNCEACHGPGREHVERRRAGNTEEVYQDLASLGSEQESRVCGACHGFQLKRYVFPPAEDGLPQIFVTSLVYGNLRPDGTQHLTSYQYPGHVLSAGFAQKILHCKDCHAPHGLEARGKDGGSAVGNLSNHQCTACHDDMIAAAKVQAHTHHPPKVRCVDCHMSYSWIGDDDRRRQRTSDHSISVPHPRESIDFGTPNACNGCHEDRTPQWSLDALRRWRDKDALGLRDWVETIAAGRKRTPGAAAKLVAVLTDADTGQYLKASALDLLDLQPPDPSLAAAIAPFAESPDPYLRTSAIRALDDYDPPGRQRRHAAGLADASPYVRMETFAMVKDVSALEPEAIDRQLADVMAYMSPPIDGLLHLAAVRRKRGELREALQTLDLLHRVTLPDEQRRLRLDGLRDRMLDELAKQRAAERR